MDKFEFQQPFHFIRTVFVLCGLWYEDKNWKTSYLVYSIFVQVFFNWLYVASMVYNMALIENFEDVTEALFMTLTEIMQVVKTINFIMNRERLLGFLKKVESPMFRLQKEEEFKEFQRENDNFNKVRRAYYGICWTCGLLGYVASALSNGQKLPFPAWFPLDWKNNKNYFWTAYVYQILTMTLTSTLNATYDLVNGYIPYQISLLYRLTSRRLEATGHEIDKVATQELLQSVKMHQFVTSMVDDAQDFLTIPLFAQFNISGIVLCFTAFQLTLISPITDAGRFISYALFMGCMLVQILLPCYYGNELSLDSELVLTAAYSSNWTEQSMKYKKMMYHFMERLKRPAILKAGGFFVIGISALMSVIRGSYSLFALLINLEK